MNQTLPIIKYNKSHSDKSITHRMLIICSLLNCKTTLYNVCMSEDIKATIEMLKELGVHITCIDNQVIINARGLYSLSKPSQRLNAHNSATAMRLLSGVLINMPFETIIDGDESLNSRPMDNLINALRMMSGNIKSLNDNGRAPLLIQPTNYKAPPNLIFNNTNSSAQIKSAMLISNLYQNTKLKIKENPKSRNHTELLIKYLKDNDYFNDDIKELKATIPGDISSASFVLIKNILLKRKIILSEVSLNKTRIYYLEILKQSGIKFKFDNVHKVLDELVGDIIVLNIPQTLKPIKVSKSKLPYVIDEIPILIIYSMFAKGKSVFENLSELRFKESDRLESLKTNLTKLNANFKIKNDTLIIKGPSNINSSSITTNHDHRIAMAFYVLKVVTKLNLEFDDLKCIDISYPNFFEDLNI